MKLDIIIFVVSIGIAWLLVVMTTFFTGGTVEQIKFFDVGILRVDLERVLLTVYALVTYIAIHTFLVNRERKAEIENKLSR